MIQRLALTGATGFLGREVLKLCVESGVPIRCLTHASGGTDGSLAQFMSGDLLDSESLARFVSGCSHLIHLAGIAHTDLRTKADCERVNAINVEGTRRIVGLAKQAGVTRMIFASSAQVYGDTGSVLTEDNSLSPKGFYAQSKVEAERICLDAQESGFDVVIARPCLIYGPCARFNLSYLMRAIDRGYYFHLSGKDPCRSFVANENAARAIVHLLKFGEPGGIYNIADRAPVSLRTFVNNIAELMGRRRPATMPYKLVNAAATACTPLGFVGLKLPITRASVRKLTEEFTLSTQRLSDSGFQWAGTESEVLKRMIQQYLASRG